MALTATRSDTSRRRSLDSCIPPAIPRTNTAVEPSRRMPDRFTLQVCSVEKPRHRLRNAGYIGTAQRAKK